MSPITPSVRSVALLLTCTGLLGACQDVASAPVVTAAAGTASACADYRIIGDAITEPLEGRTGQPERGRQLAFDRDGGDCTICHRLPLPDRTFHGNIGPSLDAVGARLTPAQLRLRLVAPKQLWPDTIMPAYCAIDGLYRVEDEHVGSAALSAQDIEDVVAWLSTLRGTETET